jgi:hypothetical protein
LAAALVVHGRKEKAGSAPLSREASQAAQETSSNPRPQRKGRARVKRQNPARGQAYCRQPKSGR